MQCEKNNNEKKIQTFLQKKISNSLNSMHRCSVYLEEHKTVYIFIPAIPSEDINYREF